MTCMHTVIQRISVNFTTTQVSKNLVFFLERHKEILNVLYLH